MIDSYFLQSAPTMNSTLGSSPAQLRRARSLIDQGRSTVSGMVTTGATSAGASSVTLRLASGEPFRGLVPAGLVLTVAGEDLVASADAEADQGATSLVVQVAEPGPVGSIGDAEPVALAEFALLDLVDAMVYSVRAESIPSNLAGLVSFGVSIPVLVNPNGRPRVGDVVVLGDGRSGSVLAIPEDGGGSWDALAGRVRRD